MRVFPTVREASGHAAGLVAAALRARPEAVLVLASGKTMLPVYRALVRLHREGRAPFARAHTFNLDELTVAPEDPRSFRVFMEKRLFSRVDLSPERIHFLIGNARDRGGECARYEEELSRRAPADVALVGLGANGHVAYLEPGPSLPPETSEVSLSRETRAALAADGVRPVPRTALTMGLETILGARRMLLVATGRAKAWAVACALKGPVSAGCPASYLSLHPALTVVLDRAAAGELRARGPHGPRFSTER